MNVLFHFFDFLHESTKANEWYILKNLISYIPSLLKLFTPVYLNISSIIWLLKSFILSSPTNFIWDIIELSLDGELWNIIKPSNRFRIGTRKSWRWNSSSQSLRNYSIIQAAKQHAPKNKFARLSNEKPVMLNSVKETLQYQKHLCKKYIHKRTSSSSRRKW